MKVAAGGCHQDAFGAVVRSGYRREEDARVVLAEWRGSGLELEEFARRHRLSRRRMQRWSERLSPRRGLTFHPLAVRVEEPVSGGPSSEDCGVALVLRGGRRIAVGRDFDEGVLTRVVRVVDSLGC
jgi:hypothetical protein